MHSRMGLKVLANFGITEIACIVGQNRGMMASLQDEARNTSQAPLLLQCKVPRAGSANRFFKTRAPSKAMTDSCAIDLTRAFRMMLAR